MGWQASERKKMTMEKSNAQCGVAPVSMQLDAPQQNSVTASKKNINGKSKRDPLALCLLLQRQVLKQARNFKKEHLLCNHFCLELV